MRAVILALSLLLLAGCGYVGPVQPPSPEIPTVVTDLAASERGDKLLITFNTPPRTVDGVAITRFSHVDLRIGPSSQPPESTASIEIPPPPPSDKEDPQPEPIAFTVDSAQYSGQRIAVTVRTAMKKNGHFSAWAKPAVFTVYLPLPKPVVAAQPSSQGVILTWAASDAAEFRIVRQGPSDKNPVEIAVVPANTYTDSTAQYDTDYRYTVTARKDSTESLPSEPATINFPDRYPPASPSGLAALIAPESIDLAWQRNIEPDLLGYYIYRSVNGGPFQRLGDLVSLPIFSDHSAEHGKTYAYRITAIDKKSNESSPSPVTDVQF